MKDMGYCWGWEDGDLAPGTLVARSLDSPDGVGGGPLTVCAPWECAVVHIAADTQAGLRTDFVATLCRARPVAALVPVRAAAATCAACVRRAGAAT